MFSRKGRLLIETIIVDENQHKHIFNRTNDTFFSFTDKNEAGEEITIEIEPKDLYEIPSNFIVQFLSMLITGVVAQYLVVVNKQGQPIKEGECEISGKVLKVARDWKGLDQAIKDSFGSQFNMPRLGLIVGIALAILVIGFLVWKGFIPTPQSWGINP
jgi:hypothetical protein